MGRWRLFFSSPLCLGVICSSCLLEECRVVDFLGDHPGMVSVFNTLLGSTADTCSHQSTRPFWKNYVFYVKGGLWDLEVDPRPSDCKL